mgnify:CR=1 FL=1
MKDQNDINIYLRLLELKNTVINRYVNYVRLDVSGIFSGDSAGSLYKGGAEFVARLRDKTLVKLVIAEIPVLDQPCVCPTDNRSVESIDFCLHDTLTPLNDLS